VSGACRESWSEIRRQGVRLRPPSGESELVAAWCAGLTALTIVLAYRERGLSRASGGAITMGYAAFAASVLASALVQE
jgi:hypothetical protein